MAADPGPLARFQAIVAKDDTMSIIVQRVTDGETLKEIAKAWQIPYGKLAEWVIEDRDRAEAYSLAQQIWVDALAQESVQIADSGGAEAGEVQRDKLRIDTRLKLAAKLNRNKYGDAIEHKHTGSVSLIAVLSSLPRGRVLEAETVPALPAGTSLEKIPAEKPAVEAFEI